MVQEPTGRQCRQQECSGRQPPAGATDAAVSTGRPGAGVPRQGADQHADEASSAR